MYFGNDISAEDTFEQDIPLSQTEDLIRRLAEKVWLASRRESRIARTVVLKLKSKEFIIHTRSHTPTVSPASCEELTAIALSLRERADLGPERLFRLVGVGLGNFRESREADRSAVSLQSPVGRSTAQCSLGLYDRSAGAEVAGSRPVVPAIKPKKKRFYGKWQNHEPSLRVLTRALGRSAPSLVFEFASFEGVESFFFPPSSNIVMTLLLG